MRRFKGLSFTILAVGFLLLLYLLEDTTDHYFCVAIKRAVQAIGLSPEVAGVTFLSVGNGASDVFSSIAAFAGGLRRSYGDAGDGGAAASGVRGDATGARED